MIYFILSVLIALSTAYGIREYLQDRTPIKERGATWSEVAGLFVAIGFNAVLLAVSLQGLT